MLAESKTKVKWSKSTKRYYEDLGYKFTEYGDELLINISDLPHGSHNRVNVICDYCGNIVEKRYFKYINSRKIVKKDACKDCNFEKVKEINIINYGVGNAMQCKEISVKSSKNKDSKHKLEDVRLEFEKRDYLLISEDYKGAHSHLEYVCLKHKDKGVLTITYNNMVTKGTGCKYCANESKMSEHTSLIKFLRGKTYSWRKSVLLKHDNRCVITGSTENLDVHHLKSFLKIVLESLSELNMEVFENVNDYSSEELDMITNSVLSKHTDEIGVPVLNKIHTRFHAEYGRVDFTEEDFYEFKNKLIIEMERC